MFFFSLGPTQGGPRAPFEQHCNPIPLNMHGSVPVGAASNITLWPIKFCFILKIMPNLESIFVVSLFIYLFLGFSTRVALSVSSIVLPKGHCRRLDWNIITYPIFSSSIEHDVIRYSDVFEIYKVCQ